MGLFSFFTREIAIDLGTANTLIIHDDKIVVDEPSIIAISKENGKLIAIGEKARQMFGKTHEGIKVIRPLKDGVIADFNAAELMIRGMIKMIPTKNSFFTQSVKLVICIPSGSTEVEIRAVRDSSEHAGAREVYLIHEPMAAALGIGIDVELPEGNMVIDVGGGTTEIAVISLGGIVCNESMRIAGDEFTEDIQVYMRQQYNLKVGERTAEEIKFNVGAVYTDLEDPPPDYVVRGPNQLTALPVEIAVSHKEISECVDKSVLKIESGILRVLEKTPPELYADIVRNGIYLTGGGSLLRGMANRFSDKLGIAFHVSEDPLRAIARGTGIALKNIDNYHFLIR